MTRITGSDRMGGSKMLRGVPLRISIGSDHGGYGLKEAIKTHLLQQGHEVEDVGTHGLESVDYPVFGQLAAERVASGDCERGIVICSTGIGVSIAANKVRGIRAALCCDLFTARLTREHNDTNVLALGQYVLGERLALAIVDTWLETPFSGGDRHARRIEYIRKMEE